MQTTLNIFTDGSCLGNPGPGGYGVIIIYKSKEIDLKGSEPDTTNNRMEMTAIIKALEWVNHNFTKEQLKDIKINIYSDSNLIIQTLNQGWKKKANLDLWEQIDQLRGWLDINWTWVKAHDTNKYNNKVDKIAFNQASIQKAKK